MFRCGATEHKTVNCPFNEGRPTTNNDVKSTIKIDLTNNPNKRMASGPMDGGPAMKMQVSTPSLILSFFL